MLSSVSKLADKPFVVGFLLPSLVFAVAVVNMFPMPCWLVPIINDVKVSNNPFANLTYFVLAIWIIATVLLIVNYDAYQILEGYLPPMSWFGWCTQYHRARLVDLLKREQRYRDARDLDKASDLREHRLGVYPSEPDWILPTAFGNTLRSFETYSWDVYHADAVVLWPRLAAVVPKEFKTELENARSQVDFLVSLCVLGWVTAAIGFCEFAWQIWGPHGAPCVKGMSVPSPLTLCFDIAGALLASLIFYRWAIHALGGWGELVKSVSDCYLPALATQLGYVLPDQETDRWQFWENVTVRFEFRRAFPEGFNPIAAASPTVKARPTEASEIGDNAHDGFLIRSVLFLGALRIVSKLAQKRLRKHLRSKMVGESPSVSDDALSEAPEG
jgi:hypothetical protein